MITPYKSRYLEITKPILVYRNLNKKCLSIKQNGIIVAHADSVTLKSCTFIVNEGGRQRVLTERQKNVHAYIKGFLTEDRGEQLTKEIYYNPYITNTFVFRDTNNPTSTANLIRVNTKGIWCHFQER